MARYCFSLLRSIALPCALSCMACLGNFSSNSFAPTEGSNNSAGGGGGTAIDSSSNVPALTASTDSLPIRRLLNREAAAAYRDLLGQDVAAVVTADSFSSDSSSTNYDNDVNVQSMSSARLDKHMSAALAATNIVMADNRIVGTLGCSSATIDDACIQKFLATFGRRLFRRSMTPDEVGQYKKIFASESSSADGARLMLRAMLAAPAFLYQPEVGTTDGAKSGYVRLTPLEVASKMSFLLLGTTPSEALLDAAENGGLSSKDDIAQAANEMLQQPAGKAYLRNFAVNWLGLAAVASTTSTGDSLDTPQLHADMTEETLRLFDDFAQSGNHFADIFAASYTYVSPSLAAVYGLQAPSGGQWTKVNWTDRARAGLLTHASIANATGVKTYPSIFRGKYVFERLLCGNAGAPPANAEQVGLPMDLVGKSERERLAGHLSSPSCAACHKSFDTIGYGFERYDALGRFQSTDSSGHVLTGQGSVNGDAGFAFTDASELGKALAVNDVAQRCLARRLAQYLLGRTLVAADASLLAQIESDLKSKDLPAAVVSFVKSDSFLTRRVD